MYILKYIQSNDNCYYGVGPSEHKTIDSKLRLYRQST